MFSAVLPLISECAPHELLPIMPPNVQWSCVEGSGPYVRPWTFAAFRTMSQITPGSTRARLSFGNSSKCCRYFDQSITTATLQLWPARLVPPPRLSTG